jgi:hypothetical protein
LVKRTKNEKLAAPLLRTHKKFAFVGRRSAAALHARRARISTYITSCLSAAHRIAVDIFSLRCVVARADEKGVKSRR